jgi:hypothetical protein
MEEALPPEYSDTLEAATKAFLELFMLFGWSEDDEQSGEPSEGAFAVAENQTAFANVT